MYLLNEKLIYETINEMGKLHKGFKTGFEDLDYRLKGLQNGKLYVLGGRPSMGKTTFAMNAVCNVAMRQNAPVLWYGFEESKNNITARLLHINSGIEPYKIKSGTISNEEWNRLMPAAQRLSLANIYVEDECRTIEALVDFIKEMVLNHGIKMVVIDYLQLIYSNKAFAKRQEEIAYICTLLKRVTKETDIPILLLSQLNRKADRRSDHWPRMSDLKYSSAIEECADTILLLHRDNYYNGKQEESEIAYVVIAKDKDCNLGTIELKYICERGLFENI